MPNKDNKKSVPESTYAPFKELTKERIMEVAEQHGLKVTFNSDNPGFHYVNKNGEKEHYTYESVFPDLLKLKEDK